MMKNVQMRLFVPTTLMKGGPILVVGRDNGGGAKFAVSKGKSPEILYLCDGSVTRGEHDNEYDNVFTPEKIIAKNFVDFLRRIIADIDASIAGREDWEFMA